MLEVRAIPAALFDANCYVLWDTESRQALIVDPGLGTAQGVQQLLDAEGLVAAAVLLTHGHGDHVWEAEAVSEAGGGIPVYITEPDMFFLDDPAGLLGISTQKFGLGSWRKPELLTPISNLEFAPVEGINLRVIPAPGHSPGSAVFLVGAQGLGAPLGLSGDVIFKGTVGRTDLLGGNEQEMRQSLRTLANVMDPATTLLPGHGPQTTWAKELDSNPFVRRATRMG